MRVNNAYKKKAPGVKRPEPQFSGRQPFLLYLTFMQEGV